MSESIVVGRISGTFAVCRLPATAEIPAWALGPGPLVSVTRTDEELSIIAPEQAVPASAVAQRGYVAYAVVGPLDFSLVGLLAKLTTALANANVPVLAISTYDTDILLVRRQDREAAEGALREVAVLQ